MGGSDGEKFRRLNWDDLTAWAGSHVVAKGRAYQRSGRVEGLGQTGDGTLVAWVQGNERYATSVGFDGAGLLVSACTCPYWATCKHAVAVVVEHLEGLRAGRPVAAIPAEDKRLRMLRASDEGSETEDGANGQDEEQREDGALREEEEPDEEDNRPSGRSARKIGLSDYLRQQEKEELITLLERLAVEIPEVRTALEHRRRMSRGDAGELLRGARALIGGIEDAADEEDAWESDDGEDYERLKETLHALLDQQRYDEVMELGEELLAAGTRRIEASHEGEMGREIRECLALIFEGAARAPRPALERMVWAFDMHLHDPYGLCGEDSLTLQGTEFSSADWSSFADVLLARLERDGAGRESAGYYRDQLSNQAIVALGHAGRQHEVLALCEREAPRTGSYARLAAQLEQAGRRTEAETWLLAGIRAEDERQPGSVEHLRAKLRELREKAEDWPQVAALLGEDFFHSPSLASYGRLLEAAARCSAEAEVREAALRFLETGRRPAAGEDAGWPLPAPLVERRTSRFRQDFPALWTIVEIAIHERRPADVLSWYRKRPATAVAWGGTAERHAAVAAALVDLYPDESLAIWKRLAEALIAQAQVGSYQAASGYLRTVRKLLEQRGRQAEWLAYQSELRRAHSRKRRFLEILESVGGRPILDGLTTGPDAGAQECARLARMWYSTECRRAAAAPAGHARPVGGAEGGGP